MKALLETVFVLCIGAAVVFMLMLAVVFHSALFIKQMLRDAQGR